MVVCWRQIRAWLDISMFVITLVATFWLGPVQGSYIALGLSAYQYIKRVTLPNISVLGQCTRTGEWHEPGEVPDICTIEGIVVLRIKYRLFFGNVDQLRAIMGRIGTQFMSCHRICSIDFGVRYAATHSSRVRRQAWRSQQLSREARRGHRAKPSHHPRCVDCARD